MLSVVGRKDEREGKGKGKGKGNEKSQAWLPLPLNNHEGVYSMVSRESNHFSTYSSHSSMKSTNP